VTLPAPDLAREATRAWRIPTVSAERVAENPAWGACVAGWLVEQPGAHVAWSQWHLSVCHLREIAGTPPAVLYFPEATHEFQFLALDPSYPVESLRPEDGKWHHLVPVDLIHQVHLFSDAKAEQLMERCVRRIVSGKMTADSDFRRLWKSDLTAWALAARTES
jgi:hypothetical protein